MFNKRRNICIVSIALLGWGLSAQAASIRAFGGVDLDGDFVRESSMEDIEPNVPGNSFSRSAVSVFDTDVTGVYTYVANSNIGTGFLSVSGTLDNTTGTVGSNIEIGALTATASLDDVITLESALPGDYDVTFELVVDGNLDVDGSNSRGNASLGFGPNPGLDGSDFGSWTTSGSVNDILTVTQTFNGSVDADIRASLAFTIFSVDPGARASGNLMVDLRMILPDGVSLLASESETFFESKSPPVVVPLPAAFPLFSAGLATIGFCMRRRKSSERSEQGAEI